MTFLHHLGEAALMTAGMFWQTLWSLVLGFSISALLQATVSGEDMRKALGRDGPKEIALATVAGAASSSCSYASAAIMRTLFKKGAALASSLAFMIASTNLVLELGLILLVLLGWKFMLGQWIGGAVLVAIMSVIVKYTAPKGLIEEARNHEERGKGHNHMAMQADGDTWWARVTDPKTLVYLAQSFAMEWSMLWKDLAVGFVVGGLVSAFVPDEVWKAVFLHGASPWIAVPLGAVVGPLIAIVTFVCSVGNIPLAAILWGGGASFAGVLSFIYADLIVLPLLDTYRRYFGWRMAAYLFAVLFSTMVLAGIVVDVGFSLAHVTPAPNPNVRAEITHFSLNYTFWLNLMLGAWAAWLLWLNHRNPMDHSTHHGGAHEGHGADHGNPAPPTAAMRMPAEAPTSVGKYLCQRCKLIRAKLSTSSVTINGGKFQLEQPSSILAQAMCRAGFDRYRGKHEVNVVPWSSDEVTWIVPLWAATISCVM